MEIDRETRWPRWTAAAFGFLWFLVLGGAHALVPTHVDWLMRDDWFAHLSGWFFFRIAPWQFPLGSAPGLLFPYGTSVAFTDGNPWLGVCAKLLSPLLPVDFQYIGLWLCFCFVSMGYFGARLTSVFTSDPLRLMLGGVLCTLAPVLTARLGHPTLCAHWLLLAALWLNLRQYDSRQQARRALVLALGLSVLAAGLHPYWVVMLGALWLALLVRLAFLERLLSAAEASAGAVLLTAASFSVLLLFGYLGTSAPPLGAEGFDTFSADLTSLFNPGNFSRHFRPLPTTAEQAEGYGYLGLGVLTLRAPRGGRARPRGGLSSAPCPSRLPSSGWPCSPAHRRSPGGDNKSSTSGGSMRTWDSSPLLSALQAGSSGRLITSCSRRRSRHRRCGIRAG
jgi:hypothetical protein